MRFFFPRSTSGTAIVFIFFFYFFSEGEAMSRHGGNFTGGVLVGAVYLAGSLSFSAMARGTPPNFAPDRSIGWYAYNRLFIPPARGAGPAQQDPAHPYV